MNEQEIIDSFLTTFKDLEKELIRISRIKDDYVSFSRALNQIYYNRMNPILSQRDNYDFLKTASDIRNILSHENDACLPTKAFLTKFNRLAKAVISPFKCYDICTKDINSIGLSTPVLEACNLMNEKKLTHLPILDGRKRVLGVFSRSTIFDRFNRYGEISLDDSYTIRDFSDEVKLDAHSNEEFFFVSRKTDVLTAFGLISKKRAHDKVIGLLLVTENGKADEALLGVITATDLARLSISAE